MPSSAKKPSSAAAGKRAPPSSAKKPSAAKKPSSASAGYTPTSDKDKDGRKVYTKSGKEYVRRKKPDGTYGMRQAARDVTRGGMFDGFTKVFRSGAPAAAVNLRHSIRTLKDVVRRIERRTLYASDDTLEKAMDKIEAVKKNLMMPLLVLPPASPRTSNETYEEALLMYSEALTAWNHKLQYEAARKLWSLEKQGLQAIRGRATGDTAALIHGVYASWKDDPTSVGDCLLLKSALVTLKNKAKAEEKQAIDYIADPKIEIIDTIIRTATYWNEKGRRWPEHEPGGAAEA